MAEPDGDPAPRGRGCVSGTQAGKGLRRLKFSAGTANAGGLEGWFSEGGEPRGRDFMGRSDEGRGFMAGLLGAGSRGRGCLDGCPIAKSPMVEV